MFKIGLENRDFCKSLHFYIVDAEKKKKKKKKKKTSCICWLVQLLSALRAMPSLFVFLVLRGACQRPDSGRWKKKKKKKKNQLHLLACSAALGPSGRGHRPSGDALTICFSCAAGRLPAP